MYVKHITEITRIGPNFKLTLLMVMLQLL
jgi:hypothetical protein